MYERITYERPVVLLKVKELRVGLSFFIGFSHRALAAYLVEFYR